MIKREERSFIQMKLLGIVSNANALYLILRMKASFETKQKKKLRNSRAVKSCIVKYPINSLWNNGLCSCKWILQKFYQQIEPHKNSFCVFRSSNSLCFFPRSIQTFSLVVFCVFPIHRINILLFPFFYFCISKILCSKDV